MVQAEELYRRIKQEKPFVPLRVHRKDGRFHDIVHPELVIVAEDYLIIGIPALGEQQPIYDYLEFVDYTDIDQLEPLPASAALSA